MRAQVRPRSSQVPSPMAGILAPPASTNWASTNCMSAPCYRLRVLCPAGSTLPTAFPIRPELLFSGFGESGENRIGGVSDHGEQCPRRSPRGPLALFPVADGLDGNAEPCRELLLSELSAAAQVAHFERSTLWRSRRQRELLPVPQFDNPSVRFEPQALHRGYP